MADIFEIAGRIHSTSQEGVATVASEILDETQNKKQSEVNVDVARHENEIHGTGGIDSRLSDVEQLAEISIGGGDAQIATGADFTNPDATKRAKVPTVGAIVDGLNDGVYDVSKRNPTSGPNSDGKFTLEYILANADTLIPTSRRHGGMEICFVHSSDNKYIQARCMAQNFTTDITQWQGVDTEPTAESNSLVESGGVYQKEYFLSAIVDGISNLNLFPYLIGTDTWYNAGYKHVCIPINPNSKITLAFSATSYYSLFKIYSVPTADNLNFPLTNYATGYSGRVAHAAGTFEVTAPSDANYLYIANPQLTLEQLWIDGIDYSLPLNCRLKFLQNRNYRNDNGIYTINLSVNNIDSLNNVANYINGEPITRENIYNCIKAIKFFGCDKTEKRTLCLLWNRESSSIFRFTTLVYRNSAWESEFDKTVQSTDYMALNPSRNGIVTISIESGSKKVVAVIDTSILPDSYVVNNTGSTTNPEIIFNDFCYDDGIEDDIRNLNRAVNGYSDSFNSDLFINSGAIDFESGAVVASGYKYTNFIPVQEGAIVNFKAAASSGAAAIAAYRTNNENSYIKDKSVHGNSASTAQEYGTYRVERGVNYLRFNSSANADIFAALTLSIVYDGDYIKKENITQYAIAKPVLRMFPKTKLPCVSFRFDDVSLNDDLVVELFDRYNSHCSFAFIASDENINNYGKKYLEWCNRGYSVISHSIDWKSLTPQYYPTYESAAAAIIGSKNKLEAAGFTVNGFSCPSGDIDSSFIPLVEAAYAHVTRNTSQQPTRNSDPCEWKGQSMQNTSIANVKAAIDDAITNDLNICIYGHANDFGTTYPAADDEEWNIQKVEEILQYVIAKRNSGLVYFGNQDECAKYFWNID